MKNVGLVTYSTSEYFQQHWLEVLEEKLDNFSHLRLDMKLNISQKQKVLSAFINDNSLDLLIITIGGQVFYPSFYKNLPVNKFFYFTDDDWAFDMQTRFMCQYANLVATQNQSLLTSYKKIHANALWMPWAANPHMFRKMDCKKRYDATFIGGAHSNRYEALKFLKDNGVNLKIFGGGWQAYSDMKDIWGGFLDSNDFVKVINQSRINLNFLMTSTMDMYEIKGRLFEISGAGGFQLCDDYEEVYKYYEKDKEIVTYKSKEELLSKINYYLKNEKEREKIARAGYERTMKEHTWDKRFEKLLKELNKSEDEIPKRPEPYISNKRITILYKPNKAKIDEDVAESLNCQTVPNVDVLIVSSKENLKQNKMKYESKILKEKDLENFELGSDYISYIEDGNKWEPEKLQFQAFALEQDGKKGIYTNFAGWGVCRSSQEGEVITYYLRWLRDYAQKNNLVKKMVIPSSLMFNLEGFNEPERIELKQYLLSKDSNLISSIFSDRIKYLYIDIQVSLVQITEGAFWKLINRLERNEGKLIIGKGCRIDLRRYLLSLVLRFKWIKAFELVRGKKSISNQSSLRYKTGLPFLSKVVK